MQSGMGNAFSKFLANMGKITTVDYPSGDKFEEKKKMSLDFLHFLKDNGPESQNQGGDKHREPRGELR